MRGREQFIADQKNFTEYVSSKMTKRTVAVKLSPAERAYEKVLSIGAKEYASDLERMQAVLQGLTFYDYLLLKGLGGRNDG